MRAWVNPQATLTVEDESPVNTAGIVQSDEADWALVPVPTHRPPAGFAPVVFGSLDRESTEPLQVVALGLPRFRLRDRPDSPDGATEGSPLVREVVAAGGQMISAGGQKTGVVTMTVVGAPDNVIPTTSGDDDAKLDEAASVWEGMSGAAVWAGALLVGVVVRHELAEGAAALTVHPVPTLTKKKALSWSDDVPGLRNPVPVRSASARLEETYRRTAVRLAPALLSGRSDEVSALEAFAVGGGRWWWWSAVPFAGKTALTAWWVACRSDPQVAVVACFMRRSELQNTGDHVVRAWAEQLGALAGLPADELRQLRLLAADAAGITRLRELIEEAVRQCPRTVLVVDGLDEYAPTGTVSVAEWLPDVLSLPVGAALLVTSRTGSPHGIPAGHPLHQHVHRLDPSPVAAKIRELAEIEIETALQDPTRLDHRILSFLAAADGPLTRADLATLIQRAGAVADPSDIDTVWRRHLSRTLTHDPGIVGSGTTGYAFSHDALRDSARHRFADDLPSRREVLHRWAAEFVKQSWPADTPAYLLNSYPRMLADLWRLDPSQVSRLVDLVTEKARFERLRAVTGGDTAALTELTMAIQLLTTDPAHPEQLIDWRPGTCTHPDPALDVLAIVVCHRDRLQDRNRAVPIDLPAVWVSLGQRQRAEELARAIPDPPSSWSATALTNVAIALVQAGQPDHAVRIAEELQRAGDIGSPGRWGLMTLAEALARAGQLEDAERVAAAIDDSWTRTWALVRIAEALAGAGQFEDAQRVAAQAERAAADIDKPWDRAQARVKIAEALARVGQLEDAERVAAGIEYPKFRVEAQVKISDVLARAGHLEGAKRLAGEAELAAADIDDPLDRVSVLTGLAVALAAAGQLEDALRLRVAAYIDDPFGRQEEPLERIAEALAGADRFEDALRVAADIDDRSWRARALARISEALAGAGQLEDALRVAVDIDDRSWRAEALTRIAEALAGAGHLEGAQRVAGEAERTAADIDNLRSRTVALTGLAGALAGAGQLEDARRVAAHVERVAADIDKPGDRAEALVTLAEALAQAGQFEDAQRVTVAIEQPDSRVEALASIAEALAAAEQLEDAERVAGEVERVAADIDKPGDRAERLVTLAEALAGAGQLEDAQRVAAAIDNLRSRTVALARIADALAGAGQLEDAQRVAAQAERTAADIDEPSDRAEPLARIAEALAGAGQLEDAQRVAAAIANNLGSRTAALARIAEALAAAGQLEDAKRVAGEAERAASDIEKHGDRAEALVKIGKAMARLGQLDDALRVAADVGYPYSEAGVLPTIAAVVAGAGQLEEAHRVAADINDPGFRIRALATMAEALAAAGQLEDAKGVIGEAELAAADPDYPYLQGWPLARIAEALARAGQLEDAQRVVPHVAEPGKRAEALATIAFELAQTGDMTQAARIIAAIWTFDEWTTPLPALAAIRSSALVTLAKLELEANRQS
jgi:tetratricopeptide (TPR) repeat protein